MTSQAYNSREGPVFKAGFVMSSQDSPPQVCYRRGETAFVWCSGVGYLFTEARPLPEQQNWLIFILAVNSSSSNFYYRVIRLFGSISSRSNSTTGFYLLCNNWEPEAKLNKQHNINKGEKCWTNFKKKKKSYLKRSSGEDLGRSSGRNGMWYTVTLLCFHLVYNYLKHYFRTSLVS